jgi:hypothetical protein
MLLAEQKMQSAKPSKRSSIIKVDLENSSGNRSYFFAR